MAPSLSGTDRFECRLNVHSSTNRRLFLTVGSQSCNSASPDVKRVEVKFQTLCRKRPEEDQSLGENCDARLSTSLEAFTSSERDAERLEHHR